MLAHSFPTSIGRLTAVEYNGLLTRILFANHTPGNMPQGESPVLIEAERQITDYLSGKRRDFDLPLDIRCSGFRKDVMDAMARIPYGTTVTYGELAEMSGHPNAARAVGNVCKTNPLPLIYPCHRVVPSTGGIGAYGGTPKVKEYLLRIEGALQ